MSRSYIASAVTAIALAAISHPSAAAHPTNHARGTFEVKLTAQVPDDAVDDVTVGRASSSKTFEGDLQGTSKGEMLTAMTKVKNSAVYVAMERVTATLDGRSGTFVLAHRGTMRRGAQELEITVVPDSGTNQLAGISGTMAITIVDGRHLYDFEYSLVESR